MKYIATLFFLLLSIAGRCQGIDDTISLEKSIPVVITDCYERHSFLFFRQKIECNYFIVILNRAGQIDYYVDDNGRMIPRREMIRYHTFAPPPNDWVYIESPLRMHRWQRKNIDQLKLEMTDETRMALDEYLKIHKRKR